MKNKEYSKPVMAMVRFMPQEYIAVCEYYLDGFDPINGTQITSSTKFWLDSNQDGIINGTDYDHHSTHQTDGAGWGNKDQIVKAWWASSNTIGNHLHDYPGDFEEYQRDGKAGYVDAVINPANDHYHAGTITYKKNHS